jgi:hypothetical protein
MKNRNNKIIVAEINHKSTPEMGARVPSIKKPDDAADMGAADAIGLALRLRLQNLEPKEERRRSV